MSSQGTVVAGQNSSLPVSLSTKKHRPQPLHSHVYHHWYPTLQDQSSDAD
jgi:hypothetical protein